MLIIFTDNAYEAGALKTNENTLVWRNNIKSIQSGTVITVTCPGAGEATTDLGTVVSGSLNGLSAANENLFIYEGLSLLLILFMVFQIWLISQVL